MWNVSTGNGVHEVNNVDERLNRNEPKKLFSKGLHFMFEVKEEEVKYLHIDSEEDDDENDFVVLSGKRMIKEVERKGVSPKMTVLILIELMCWMTLSQRMTILLL